mmetsp:Transcript_173213/g.555538  ORF Transcript_173213/g.555538 Transcript_173213/m.555538 type:complete len:115 (-) Transcript_173213:1814-2158(-)
MFTAHPASMVPTPVVPATVARGWRVDCDGELEDARKAAFAKLPIDAPEFGGGAPSAVEARCARCVATGVSMTLQEVASWRGESDIARALATVLGDCRIVEGGERCVEEPDLAAH